MKLKWFSMFHSNVIRDSITKEVDLWASWRQSWVDTFHDPLWWICIIGFIGWFCFLLFGQ